MTFNTVGSLLAVSSATDTVHIFKLGGKVKGDPGSSGRNAPTSPSAASIDSQNGSGGLEGGYEAFIDGKKKSGVRYIFYTGMELKSDVSIWLANPSSGEVCTSPETWLAVLVASYPIQ